MEQDELPNVNSRKVQKTMRTCVLTSISLQMVRLFTFLSLVLRL